MENKMNEELKQYLMNCDLQEINDDNSGTFEALAETRKATESYWRDRITAENI